MMEIEVLPHVGLGPFRIGMTFDEAMAAVPEWGAVKHSPTGERPPGKYVVAHEQFKFEVVLIFRENETLNSVEAWRFRDEDADVRITLEGTDIFRTPKRRLRQHLEEQGHPLDYDGIGFDAVPDLKLILANASSYEYPKDPKTGAPLYYDYALVSDQIYP
ncbi:hypothetical protein ACH44C_20910 [Streptomyces purpureus]|uniref:hypothetical protein n=1 Tax=Streptomyces purpureus TaxID=1951 RepID=UPI0037A06322